MQSPSLSKIKIELNHLPHSGLMELFVRLIKYKKENKELLSYLLFMSDDENGYIEQIKLEIDDIFEQIDNLHLSTAKKILQKTVRLLVRYAKYSSNKRTEVELFIYFCSKMKAKSMLENKNNIIQNIYLRQINRIEQSLPLLHEDLQYDYSEILLQLKVRH